MEYWNAGLGGALSNKGVSYRIKFVSIKIVHSTKWTTKKGA